MPKNKNNALDGVNQPLLFPADLYDLSKPKTAQPSFEAALDNALKSHKGQSAISHLFRWTEQMIRNSIGDWRKAWASAVSIEMPRRTKLYDIYRDTWQDGHIKGVAQQRIRKTKLKKWRIVRNGEADADAKKLLNRTWFSQYVELYLESIFWGYTWVEFSDKMVYKEDTKTIEFTKLKIVPRKHVVPEQKVLLSTPDKQQGESIGLFPLVVELYYQNDTDLGLLLGLCPKAISKKNAENSWDEFIQRFGVPLVIGKTSDRDPNSRAQLSSMLKQLGNAPWALFPEGTGIEVPTMSIADAYAVFLQRIDACDRDNSKAILTVTMTTDQGSSQAQSKTHAEMLEDVVTSDSIVLAQHINDVLLPFLLRFGYPLEGCSFEWDDTQEMILEDKIKLHQFILDNYETDTAYYEKASLDFGMKLTPKKTPPVPKLPKK